MDAYVDVGVECGAVVLMLMRMVMSMRLLMSRMMRSAALVAQLFDSD